jgi:hypothetical protein
MREMLMKDFDPPLPCDFVEGNRGRLIVRAKDLVHWMDAQVNSTILVTSHVQPAAAGLLPP